MLTEWGFGFHQVAVGQAVNNPPAGVDPLTSEANATLTASGRPVVGSRGPLAFMLHVDRGNGGKTYTVSLDATQEGTELVERLRQALFVAAGVADVTTLAQVTGLSVGMDGNKLQIRATPNRSLGDDGKVKPARMELTVKTPNTVVAGGEGNFASFEELKVSSGANTFVFGNDYWERASGLALELPRGYPSSMCWPGIDRAS